MQGKGVLTNVYEGSEFSGDFTRGKREGYGVYNYANGDIFVGEWLNNQMHGKGKYKRDIKAINIFFNQFKLIRN